MSKDDLATVADSISTSPAHVAGFAQRVHQGMANWLVALAAIRGPATKLPELRRATMEPLYDPSFVGFFGASQGHILAARSRRSPTSRVSSSTSAAAASRIACRAR